MFSVNEIEIEVKTGSLTVTSIVWVQPFEFAIVKIAVPILSAVQSPYFKPTTSVSLLLIISKSKSMAVAGIGFSTFTPKDVF